MKESAGEAARAGAGDAPPVRHARESLRVGKALPFVRDRARAEAVRDDGSPAHYAYRAPRQRSGETHPLPRGLYDKLPEKFPHLKLKDCQLVGHALRHFFLAHLSGGSD